MKIFYLSMSAEIQTDLCKQFGAKSLKQLYKVLRGKIKLLLQIDHKVRGAREIYNSTLVNTLRYYVNEN